MCKEACKRFALRDGIAACEYFVACCSCSHWYSCHVSMRVGIAACCIVVVHVILLHIGTAAMLVNLASLIVVRVYVSDAAGWLHLCLR